MTTRTFDKRAVSKDCRYKDVCTCYEVGIRCSRAYTKCRVYSTRFTCGLQEYIPRPCGVGCSVREWGRRYFQANFSTGRWLTLARCCLFRDSLIPELCTKFTP